MDTVHYQLWCLESYSVTASYHFMPCGKALPLYIVAFTQSSFLHCNWTLGTSHQCAVNVPMLCVEKKPAEQRRPQKSTGEDARIQVYVCLVCLFQTLFMKHGFGIEFKRLKR